MRSIGQIDASLRTHQGRVRDHNEDFIAYHEPAGLGEEKSNGWLYIVADGVGGAEAGEVASQYATERTVYHYLASDNSTDFGQRLLEAMRSANDELRHMVADRSSGNHMATTMVAIVVHDDQATFANVGDSRGYHWQNGILHQITKDHSLVARLVEEGAITEEEAINHPRKNVILHSLGSESTPQIDLYDVVLSPGEQLVLCSDGLTRHVSDEEIATIINEQTPEKATESFIELANDRGGEDNISVAVLRVGEQPTHFDRNAGRGAILVTDGDAAVASGTLAHRALWFYTAVLCAVQAILIILVWLVVNG